jgi:hypothetical protein
VAFFSFFHGFSTFKLQKLVLNRSSSVFISFSHICEVFFFVSTSVSTVFFFTKPKVATANFEPSLLYVDQPPPMKRGRSDVGTARPTNRPTPSTPGAVFCERKFALETHASIYSNQ